MMESILLSIKKLLGILPDYTNFDDDIIIHINTAFAILNQLGVGPKNGFMIVDENSSWGEYTTENNLNMVKTYIYLKVRLLFDPPTSSALIESINRTLSEIEWRIFLEGDPKIEDTPPSAEE
jgi:hypothetical protein